MVLIFLLGGNRCSFKLKRPEAFRMYLCIGRHYLSLKTKYRTTMQQRNKSSMLLCCWSHAVLAVATSFALFANGDTKQ